MSVTQLCEPHKSIKVAASYCSSGQEAADELSSQLGQGPFAFVLVFFSPKLSCTSLIHSLMDTFPNTPIYGCSTAGEMTLEGISDEAVVALGFLKSEFGVEAVFFPDLDKFSIRESQSKVHQAVNYFQTSRSALKPHCFALMMVDGLCFKEEQLVSAFNYGLRDIPLVGGSAGDGKNFKETKIVYNGQLYKNAAILLLIESHCPIHIFKSDSFTPTDIKFVVTKADPQNRIVYELNAMPAATAYANALGMREEDLNELTFASHPLCVCFGGDCYVRSVQDILQDGAFSFYCAIDEGIVFTLSDIDDMVDGIEKTFASIREDLGPPQLILGFDCVVRRMMSEINQSKGQISQLFKDNHVIGFNTYGEQVRSMHLNLTFSGIAIGQ